MKLKLKDLEIQSFVTRVHRQAGIEGGKTDPEPEFSEIPCSAIDACPSAGGDVCDTIGFE